MPQTRIESENESTPRACDQCDGEFVASRFWRRFCSKLCKHRWDEAHPDRVALPKRACQICGDVYQPVRVWQRYCGRRCRIKSEKLARRRVIARKKRRRSDP